ncbi:MAG: glycoside hydrolase family 127 protein, partial [Microbacterium sp.]
MTIDDAFWSPRQQRLRATTLDAQYDRLVESGRIGALRLDWTPGSPEPRPHPFWESDIAKWVEAASYSLATHPDPALEEKVDSVIDALAAAQQPDGYLNVYFTVVEPDARFTDLHDAHELYCAGHLIEAAVAHHRATGKTTLLDVMRRYADLLCEEFGPGGAHEGGYCGHEEIELALVRLFHATGEQRYLRLALAFVDARGTRPFYFELERERRGGSPGFAAVDFPHRDEHPQEFREYNQTHLPVREQSEAVGHAVRAMYLYAGMADLALETGDTGLREACERLWEHLTTKRMYVTAGIGDSRHNEGFTRDHALPNETAYNETCAAIGLVLWASRMTTLSGEARYLDVLERALYNGVLAGVSDDGQRFFYENPLASDGSVRRRDWFECACCPPNLARLEASIGSYLYSAAPGRLAVNLYVASRLRHTMGDATIGIDLRVSGPASGDVELVVSADRPTSWQLMLRVPAWADSARVTVNGEEAGNAIEQGYLRIEREWADGDRVALRFDVPVRRVYADPRVTADVGRVAITRGPFVYCAEGVDLEIPAQDLLLGESTPSPEP